jgi:hypothetical protein
MKSKIAKALRDLAKVVESDNKTTVQSVKITFTLKEPKTDKAPKDSG